MGVLLFAAVLACLGATLPNIVSGLPPPPPPPVPRANNLYAAPAAQPFTFTVTQTTTIDRSVVITDTAYNSVPVTITNLNVWTSTLATQLVLQTPVDDDVAVQTRLIEKPTTLTVTDGTSNFLIVTDVSVQRFTITHNYYNIMQATFTRTATQAITFSSTLVRTNIRTETNTKTDFRTVYNTVYVGGYH